VSLGLYVHVPFCSSICRYCNFNRGLLDDELRRRYVSALVGETLRVGADLADGRHPALAASRNERGGRAAEDAGRGAGGGEAERGPRGADTIYFGGGTPSLLEPGEIGRVVDACRLAFAVSDDAEITLEANPETVTADRMRGYRAAGVNRVSLGVQSFDDGELRRLGRVHSAARAREALAATRAAGIDNVSLDLMMWLPGQSVGQWMASVEALVRAQPDHASLYLLELHPNAPLREEMARAGWTQAPDDDAADMYEQAADRLAAAGYGHYEISNFARPGRRSRHNLKYWTAAEWLGLGCGAHSTLASVRWTNIPATAEYVRRVEAGAPVATGIRALDPARELEEALFMGLRLTEGIDLDRLRGHYGIDVWARYGERLRDHLDAGLLVREGSRLRLTRRGLLVSNDVMAVFIDTTVR
jgi:oxygen-independent coproporphyrinogen-3 oxidase